MTQEYQLRILPEIAANEQKLKEYLSKEKGLNFKIHLRDTCGRQSFWIEPLGNCACEGRYDEMYQVVEEYLKAKGFSVQYDDQKMNFVV